jgi:hypothetical protein
MKKTFFEKMLDSEHLQEHDFRPLWKYHLEENDYKTLITEVREYFEINSKYNYYRECALLVATWWKIKYTGGIPSAERILMDIGLTNVQQFIKQFKEDYHKGMRLLNIPPIRINNNQYFRSLLVQGGLPIKRLRQCGLNTYTDYVIKIYEIYIKYGKEQSRYRISIYRDLLPQTFRNECIEELTLEICEALENNNTAYLPFELEEKEAKDFWNTIKGRKEDIRQTEEKFYISLKWLLPENSEKFVLNATIPKKISKEWWEKYFPDTSVPRIFEIFIDGKNISTYKKMGDGNLCRYDYNSKLEHYKNINSFGICDGKQVNLQNFTSYPQSLEEPFLLSEAITETEKAKLFVPDNWHIDSNENSKKIEYGKVYDFIGQAIVKNSEGDSFNFDSHQPLDPDLFLKSPRLENVLESNVPIIKGEAEFIFAEGKIKNKTKEPENTKLGFIRWKIDSYLVPVFQVGRNTKLEIRAENEKCGSIIFKDFVNAEISCDKPHKLDIINNESHFKFTYSDDLQLYNIPFKISYPNAPSKKKADLKVLAPFKGAYFRDANGNRIKTNTEICPIKLEGYSLICIGEQAKVKISPNSQNDPEFKYCKIVDIEKGEHPLDEFKRWIEESLALFGNKEHSVIFSVKQEHRTVAEICFKRFNLKAKSNDINNRTVEINVCGALNELSAFCLTSKIDNGEKIKCIDLQKQEDGIFCFPDEVVGRWIVYNKEQSALVSFMPCLRIFSSDKQQDLDPLEKAISLEDEKKRIEEIQEILKNDTNILSEYWKTIATYAKFLKEERVSLDTITYFKAILQNQQLAARFFFVFIHYFGQKDTWFADIYSIVKDQNFDWRFISINAWEKELHLALITINKANFSEVIKKILMEALEKKFEEIKEKYYKIHQNSTYNKKAFGILCQKLIEEQWPTWNPKIPQYQKYLQKRKPEHFQEYQYGMFCAPFLAALLASGKDNDDWSNKPENYFRFLRCCYTTDEIWFEEAFEFFYNELRK